MTVHYLEHNETACTVLLPALGWEDVITTNADQVTCLRCITILAERVEQVLGCNHPLVGDYVEWCDECQQFGTV